MDIKLYLTKSGLCHSLKSKVMKPKCCQVSQSWRGNNLIWILQYIPKLWISSDVGLPKFSSEPMFEPWTTGLNLQVWVQVLPGENWFEPQTKIYCRELLWWPSDLIEVSVVVNTGLVMFCRHLHTYIRQRDGEGGQITSSKQWLCGPDCHWIGQRHGTMSFPHHCWVWN